MHDMSGHVKGELDAGRRMINSFEWNIGVGIGGVLVSILFRMILHSKPRGLTRFGFNSCHKGFAVGIVIEAGYLP